MNEETILLISGHGENKNKTFDPGATGYIKKGEHKYFEEDFFSAMKKFLPKNSNVVLFSDYNVYDHKNLVSLANSYGKVTIVVEMHYDAASASASGGHVIVHSNYAPDNLDLKIRDVIKKHIGVRYNHKGHQGISGRDNLGNCNRAANGGINYRLVELGFGTNKKDSDTMVKNVEAIAKDFVEALVGSSNGKAIVTKNKPAATPKPVNNSAKSIDQLANEAIQGEHGSGQDRKDALGSQYDAVQARVNELLGSDKKVPSSKSIDTLVKETLAGVHGNGEARKKSLGSNYNAVMDVINGKSSGNKSASKSINTLVDETLAGKHGNGEARKKSLGSNYNAVMDVINGKSKGSTSSKKSLDTIANEVIAGKWGNDPERSKKLRNDGYDPKAVQKLVNQKL